MAELDDFTQFCGGLRRLTGVDLGYYKRSQMERRARGMASRAGAGGLTEYLELLEEDPRRLTEFMERMTITVSQLWRNPEIFEAIGGELLPELAAARRGARLRLWCAGCSFGAEPYTLAAVCLDNLDVLGVLPRIVASDINAQMIEYARAGRFTAAHARAAPSQLVDAHFNRLPDGGLEARPELRAMIRFEQEDLLEAIHRPMDLILCRNVAIHFTPEARERLIRRLAANLAPGGMLVLGSTEMILHPGERGLERVRPFVFKRVTSEHAKQE